MKLKEWNLAIVGLPDSGKSTFLARLYGTVDDGDSVGAYSLSFPPSIDSDNDNSLAEIKDLWTWVKSHFDEKKKTLKSTRFSMHAGCPGPNNALKIIFKDHPGELFQPKDEHDVKQIAEEVIEKERKEFRDKCPQLNAIAILIEADKVQDEGNLALLKSMLTYIDEIAPKGDDGRPVFKAVVFTKACEAVGGIDTVRDACRRFTKTLTQQGRKNLKVLACESLNDLVEDGGSWKLPSPEDKRKFPKWILTPTEVVVALLRMRRSWIMRRRVLLTAASGLVISLIAGTTWFLGKQADQELYEAAMREGDDSNGTQEQRIEHYLDPNRHHDWFYPCPKEHREAVARKYKDAIWGDRGTFWAKNLDERKDFLEQHRKSATSPIANTTELNAHIKTNNLNIANAKNSYTNALKFWEEAILTSGDTNLVVRRIKALPDSIDSNYPEKSMPSLKDALGNPRMEKLRRDFDVESDKWNTERDCLASQLKDEKSFNRLSDLLRTMKANDYAYYVYRKKRENELLTLPDVIPVSELPFWSERLIAPMSNAFETCVISSSRGEAMSKIAKVVASVDRRRSEVRAASDRLAEKFKDEKYGNGQKEICKAALEELTPDCTEHAFWKDRKADVDARCAKSAKLKAGMVAEADAAKDSPPKQLEILSRKAAELVPEDRESLELSRKEVEDDWRKINSKWEELVKRYDEFKAPKGRKQYLQLKGACDSYCRTVIETGRSCISDYKKKLDEIKLACSNEETRVSNIAQKANAIQTAYAIVDKDDSAYYEALDAIIDYRDTYDCEKADRLVSNVRNQILEASTKDGMTDDEFLVWQNRISKVFERSGDLGIYANDIKDQHDKLKANWSQCRFDSVARRADAITDNDKWDERAKIWREYRMLTNVNYEVRRTEAEKQEKEEIKKGINKTERLLQGMDKSGEDETSWELTREEYNLLKTEIKRARIDLENKAGRLVSEIGPQYENFLKHYNELMDKKICVALCQHYKNRLQEILTDKDKKLLSDGVMVRWAAGEVIRGVLREMAEDEVFARQYNDIKAVRQGFDNALSIIVRDTPTIKFSIRPESFCIQNDAKNDKDSPAMEIFLHATNPAGKIRFEKNHEIISLAQNETEEIKKYERQYPKKGGALRELKVDEFKASTNTCLSLGIRWKERSRIRGNVKYIDVPLMDSGSTLAQFVSQDIVKGLQEITMTYQWKFKISEYRFSGMNIKLIIDEGTKSKIQETFTIPKDVDSFFDKYRKIRK